MSEPYKVDIYRLPEIASHYKTPKLSMLPLIEKQYFSINGHRDKATSRFLSNDTIYVPSGRVALYYALKHCGVDERSEVLLPSYHCGSMLEPVIHLSAKVQFYNLDEHLNYSLEHIKQLITVRTKAVIVPHFFGFSQDLVNLKAFLEEQNIKLIEDCAHAFYSSSNTGYIGDYAIASTVKFFPGTKGGALVANSGNQLSLNFAPPGFINELKALKNNIERTRHFKKESVLKSERVEAQIASYSNVEKVTYNTNSLSLSHYLWFDPAEIGVKNKFSNRFFIKHSRHTEIIKARKDNYNYYLRAISGIKGMRPLHSQLGDTVPYVFPLILDAAEEKFPSLKLRGVPIWRWEELALTDCNASNQYRHTLLQLPCHQSISKSDIDWIIEQFKAVLSA